MYAPSRRASGPAKLAAFRRLVARLDPEVIHSYSFYTNIAAAVGAAGSATVPIGSIRSDFGWAKADAGIVLGRLSARWPAYQISNSFAAARAAGASRSPFAPKQCAVVVNGVDLERFSESPVPVGPPRIVGLGYLLPVKRWDRLVDAAHRLKERGIDCCVDIVGDGPLRATLQNQAHALGVADRIRFLGHIDDVPSVLAGAAIVALTSDSEGAPNVVMEAMACGRAVVATDVGDIPALVENGTTGFVVGRDVAALADRLGMLITDPNLCRRMGVAARRRAEERFGLDRLGTETLSAYRAAGWHEGFTQRASIGHGRGEFS
jgi:glycosyltransferase involved in cell wall biosynthesis